MSVYALQILLPRCFSPKLEAYVISTKGDLLPGGARFMQPVSEENENRFLLYWHCWPYIKEDRLSRYMALIG